MRYIFIKSINSIKFVVLVILKLVMIVTEVYFIFEPPLFSFGLKIQLSSQNPFLKHYITISICEISCSKSLNMGISFDYILIGFEEIILLINMKGLAKDRSGRV